MAIHRVVARWTGFIGAPGYTNFFFQEAVPGGDAQDNVDRVRAFFLELNNDFLPSDVTIDIQPDIAVIDEATGALTGYALADVGTPIEGQVPGAYSAPSGGLISWRTNTIAKGRRLRGRTFIVPLVNTAYDAQGSLSSTAIGSLNDAAEALAGDAFSSTFGIWSRPVDGAGGTFGEVTSWSVPDMAAVLRSRRD